MKEDGYINSSVCDIWMASKIKARKTYFHTLSLRVSMTVLYLHIYRGNAQSDRNAKCQRKPPTEKQPLEGHEKRKERAEHHTRLH